MIVQSLVPCWNAAFLDTMLAALSTRPAAALAPAISLHLFTNDYTPTPQDLAAAYTEANFSGYAAASPTPSVPVSLSNLAEALLASATFVAVTASPFVPNNLFGYYFTAGGLLVMSERFASVVPIAGPGDFLELVGLLPLRAFQQAS